MSKDRCIDCDISMQAEAVCEICTNKAALAAEVDELAESLGKSLFQLGWIGQQPCRQIEDACECSEQNLCITEWCLPCYAKQALETKCLHTNTYFDRILATATDIEVCKDCGKSRSVCEQVESEWQMVTLPEQEVDNG